MAAAQTVVPILVDCSENGQNEALQQKYKVEGYPTILYVDPDGKQIKEMGSRDAGPVAKEIEGVAAKFPPRPSIWQSSMKSAVEMGKKAKKPVAVYLADPKADLARVNAKLMKDLGDRKAKFLWVLQIAKAESLKAHGLENAPAVVVYDPKAEQEPLARIGIKEGDKADVLNKALDEAAKKMKR